MDKRILIQYADLREEIKDLQRRIDRTERALLRMEEQGYKEKDSVRGSRRDGTIGCIMIEGFPYPAYSKTEKQLKRNKLLMRGKLDELLEMQNKTEEFIQGIEDPRIRRIFRYRYLDNMNWQQVAVNMGRRATADGCRKTHDRFLEEK